MRLAPYILLFAAGACEERTAEPAGVRVAGAQGPTGLVGGQLTLPGGAHVTTLSYTLTNGNASYVGTVAAADAETLSFTVGSVAVGSGYTLSLEAASDDGNIHCDGSAGPFDVGHDSTTTVNILLSCTSGGEAGSLLVEGAATNCPIWTQIVADPATVSVNSPGNTVQLTATAIGPDPTSITFEWTAGAGTISPASESDGGTGVTTFTCPSVPGIVPITLVVADGPVPEGGGCDPKFVRATFSLNCTGAPSCAFGTGCGDGGQICNAGGSCVPALFSVLALDGADGGIVDGQGTFLPMAIQNYDLGGNPVGSPIALPSAPSGTQQPITIMGNTVTEGDLTTSADGRYLVTAGWNVLPGGHATTSNSAVVARVDSSGTVDTSTLVTGAFMPMLSVRSAVSNDGSGFWVSGAANDTSQGNSGGIWFAPFGTSTPTQLVSLPDGVHTPDVYARWLRIFGGQLYGGFDEASPYMAAIGTGLPSGSPVVTSLPGAFSTWTGPTPSPYAFALFSLAGSGPDTMYIADDGIDPTGAGDTAGPGSAATGSGGLSKWSYSASSGWNLVWNVASGTWAADAGAFAGTPIGFRGLAGFATGTTVTLMATTADTEGNPDSLAVLVDPGGATTPTPTIVATTPPTQVLRGVALTPQ